MEEKLMEVHGTEILQNIEKARDREIVQGTGFEFQ